MNIREIMSSPAITVGPETSIQEVARIMRENHISGVPIVGGDGALLGVVTELDLIARNAPLEEPRYIAILSGYIPTSFEKYREYKEQLKQALATTAIELMDDDQEFATMTPDTSTMMRCDYARSGKLHAAGTGGRQSGRRHHPHRHGPSHRRAGSPGQWSGMRLRLRLRLRLS